MKKSSIKKDFFKGLKKSLLLLSGATIALSSCTGPSANFTGNLTGVDSDTLLVFIDYMNVRKHLCTDTVAMLNNHFELQVPDTASYIRFVPKPSSPNGAIRMFQGMPILFFPGDKLSVSGAVDNYKVLGSELYNGLSKYENIQQMQDEINALNVAFSKAYQAKDEVEKARIKEVVKVKYEKLQAAKFAVIKNNPSSVVSAYFATQLKPELGLEAIGLLSENVKKSSIGPLVVKAQESYENSLLREKAKLLMQPGNPAPDFKLTTIEGKEVSLSSFKGKHLLVDFWGTWCGWCIKGIPSMKQVYGKYKQQIEFLGVCCGDTDKKWRAAVAHHELPWVNVLEGNSKISAQYAVGGFPTKVLIDPDGKVVEVFVGESPELYKKLDQLFGK